MNDKRIFSQQSADTDDEIFMPKQQFSNENVEIDPSDLNSENVNPTLEGELLNEQFEQIMQPKSNWWKKVLAATSILFLTATVAQSIQWLINTWQANQWIYFAFAMVAFIVVILGLRALIQEFRRLRKLKKHQQIQQQSQQLFQPEGKRAEDFFPVFDNEQSRQLCSKIAKEMGIAPHNLGLQQWQTQIQDAHSSQEVAYLFSQNVLQTYDQQAIKLISQNALEAGVIVAISPLALVDMLFIAWRNIHLVNLIAKLYGMELGYFSRLRLMRLVLLNVAFAGATELVQEIGMDWLSQDIAAKLSARFAQGIGVGLLTARLGIKAMEFCRPLALQQKEKPRLSNIQRELLSHLKASVLNSSKLKRTEKL